MLRAATTGRTTVSPVRRATTLLATGLLAATLVGCGSENDAGTATDSAPTSQSATAETSPDATSEAGAALPDWAPAIATDDQDNVTGLDFSGTPAPSDELLVAEVTTGDGPPVEAGQTITADYFGQLPDESEPFDESFSSAPFEAPIGVGSLIPGWDEGLVGVPVGSRVVMSIPPDLGYGEAGSGPIPGGATLFFVVDIIAAQ